MGSEMEQELERLRRECERLAWEIKFRSNTNDLMTRIFDETKYKNRNKLK